MTSLIHYHTYSLAHKTNHSFIPNCEFGEFLHPRFGLVPSILAIHDIGAGEEIFVWYGYDLDYCPQWYMDAWAKGRYKRLIDCLSINTIIIIEYFSKGRVQSTFFSLIFDPPLFLFTRRLRSSRFHEKRIWHKLERKSRRTLFLHLIHEIIPVPCAHL